VYFKNDYYLINHREFLTVKAVEICQLTLEIFLILLLQLAGLAAGGAIQ
jgi:hypothetical protein